jgi:uncharacterized protein
MKYKFVYFSFFLGILLLCCNTILAQSPFVGHWEGALDVQGFKLGMNLHIVESESATFSCTMDVPMQSARDIPASSVECQDNAVNIQFDVLGGSYRGIISENKDSMTGVWAQAGNSFDLLLVRTLTPSSNLKRPQEPVAPFPYEIIELDFHNHGSNEDHLELAGTLTIPEGEGPFPAVVLISGSGPQNRDEELMGHKPFWIIADHFSRNGIAVLRYDDRGVAFSGGDFATSTSADFATDAAAALAFLKTHPKIKSNQIGLCGHSEGGMIAPMVAATSEDCAFIILMAGPGQKIVDLLLLQSELISRVMGEEEARIQKGNHLNRKIYDSVRGAGTVAERKTALYQVVKEAYNNMTAEEQRNEGSLEEMYAGLEATLFNPWMEYFLNYDPSVYLKQVRCPVLAINGEKDLQVAPKENLSAIEQALKSGLCKDITVREFEKLNHLFQHSQSGSPVEYATIEETIAPEVLELMVKWVVSRFEGSNDDR